MVGSRIAFDPVTGGIMVCGSVPLCSPVLVAFVPLTHLAIPQAMLERWGKTINRVKRTKEDYV